MNFILNFIDLFFPSKCIICKKYISLIDNFICNKCMEKVEYNVENEQDNCVKLKKDEKQKNFYKWNISVFKYKGIIKKLIFELKFHEKKRVIKYFLKECIKKLETERIKVDYFTPVPLNYRKKSIRGYDHVSIITKKLAKHFNIKYKKLLKEEKKINSQKKLKIYDRNINIYGKFLPGKNLKINGKTILLIDDVYTTGMTVNECARILKKIGAKEVFSLTIAAVDINNNENTKIIL